MKKCPQCGREYDLSMSFCLDDGSELLYGPASMDEPKTAILSEPPALAGGQFDGENPTRPFVHTTAAEGEPRESLGDSTERQSHSADRAAKPQTGRARLLVGLAVGVLLLVGGFLGYRYLNDGGGQISSIAVLPFANATGDKETEFLADGIAETLINNFTKIPELRVTARSTAFRFRGREDEPKAVGSELSVDSMLTGRLMQRGDSLSVQVDLINTSDGSQIWGNRYDGKTSDIVTIQQRIATEVSQQLKLKLTGAQEKEISKTYTQNPEAYQHYLRGRYHWNRRTSDGLSLAVSEFQKAVERDPAYALGYVGLADAFVLQQEYGRGKSDESLANARAYALRALEIDPSLGEAHATLGLTAQYSYQWAEAESHFKRSIELTPRHATTYQWYAGALRDARREAEALENILKAKELDPLSGIIGVNAGLTYARTGDFISAEEQLKRVIELDRSWWGGHFWLGFAKLIAGHKEDALPYLAKGVELNRSSRTLGTYGFVLGAAGRKAEALAIARELEQNYDRGGNFALNIAAVYSGLGENDKALEWLEKGYADRNAEMTRLRWYPQFDPLRDDPRFKDLLKRMNLPE